MHSSSPQQYPCLSQHAHRTVYPSMHWAGGCLSRNGVCPGGCLPRGVSAQGGVSARGVSAQGVYVSQHVLRQTSPTVDRMTDRCKNITFTNCLWMVIINFGEMTIWPKQWPFCPHSYCNCFIFPNLRNSRVRIFLHVSLGHSESDKRAFT